MPGLRKKPSAILYRAFGIRFGRQDNEDQEYANQEVVVQHQATPVRNGSAFSSPYVDPLDHTLSPRYESLSRATGVLANAENPTRRANDRGRGSDAFVSQLPAGQSAAIQEYQNDAAPVQNLQISSNGRYNDLFNRELGNERHNLAAAIRDNSPEGTLPESGPQLERAREAQDDNINVRAKRQIERVARESAPDPESTIHWRYYLECYAKGRFSLIDPPDPTPTSRTFEFLPAILPSNEEERLSSSDKYEVVWPHWAQQAAEALMQSARQRFETAHAALSTFDEDHELLKGENGYNMSRLDRSISLAAHALYTADVLVILDASKDWRFKQNPLVRGEPSIKFFAAAPLLDQDGNAVGVFAVFSRESRDKFTPFDRRELSEFGHLLMKDLAEQAEKAQWLSDHDTRSTPLLQRDSTINGDIQRRYERSPSDLAAAEMSGDLLPLGLNLKKSKSPPAPPLVLYNKSSQPDGSSSRLEYTPPSSNNSITAEDGSSLGVSAYRGVIPQSFSQVVNTPDSENWPSSSPRPWSSSDITSVNVNPPNTPTFPSGVVHNPQLFEFTVDDFMSLPDDAFHEEQSGNKKFKDLSDNAYLVQALEDMRAAGPTAEDYAAELRTTAENRARTLRKLSGESCEIISSYIREEDVREPVPAPVHQPLQPFRSNIPRPTPQSNNIHASRSSRNLRPTPFPNILRPAQSSNALRPTPNSCLPRLAANTRSSMAEAAFACASMARMFGYDFIYAVELSASRPGMKDEELIDQGGLELKIMVAHGMCQPAKLDPSLHLRALRTRGYHMWQNTQTFIAKGDFEEGRMIAMHHTQGGPLKLRTNGIIFGAFRKPVRPGARKYHDDSADVLKLAEAVEALKVILVPQPQPKPRPSRYHLFPASSSTGMGTGNPNSGRP